MTPSEWGQIKRFAAKMKQADKNSAKSSGRTNAYWRKLGVKYDEEIIKIEGKYLSRIFGTPCP